MESLTPAGLQAWGTAGTPFLLVDVREDYEREAFSLGGLHLPLGELMQRIGELPPATPLVFYCAKGIRSGIACQRLDGRPGLGPLYNLTGGVTAWQQAFGPQEL